MKNILYIFFISLFAFSLNGQQLGYDSQFTETRPFWNPAATAPNTLMSYDAFFRQQWIGFSGAPRTAYASALFPLIDLNMSIGGYVYNDATGPVTRTGAKINYAYKLQKFLTDDGILAFGISANAQQFRYNGNSQVFIDEGDGIIEAANSSTFFPSVGGGVYFNTNPVDFNREKNSFYVGFAFNHAYTTDVLLNDANFQRQRHMHFMVGGKIMKYDSYIEPSLTANYVSPEILDYILSLKYEKENAFWAGLGYSSVNDLMMQGGLILDRFLGNRYAKLRLGALANVMASEHIDDLGPGMEIFIRYEVDID